MSALRNADLRPAIGRGLGWSLLTVFVAIVYVTLVVGVGALTGDAGDDPNVVISLVATAAVAAAFQPARMRAHRLANRVVLGRLATPYEVMADFTVRMSSVLSPDDVLPQMAEAAAVGVGAAAARVTVHLPDGAEGAATWPTDAEPPRWDASIEIAHQGEPVGRLDLATRDGGALRPAETALLRDVGTQAALALRGVRLRRELEAKVAEVAEQARDVRASGQRLVAAQDDVRRSMERDIHEGAQRQLDAIAAKLEHAASLLDRDPQRAATLLDELASEADIALEQLRDLARGLFPPLLVEQGIVATLAAHVRKHRLPVTVVAGPAVLADRLPQAAEVAVYFCCLEAIRNATAHAPGAEVTVALDLEGDHLAFTVRDDGPGFDASSAGGGSGLQNMADRVAAIGGEMEVRTTPGEGTTVTGRVPVRIGVVAS